MSGVRLLVGTRKGAFVLTADGTRDEGGRRPAVRGMGDLPRERVAGRSRSPVRVPVDRVARPGRPAVRRRREDVGAGRQRVRVRQRPGNPSVVRRHAASVGVRACLALRTLADRPGHGVRRCRGRCPLPFDRRRRDVARALGASGSQDRQPVAAPAQAGCACTILIHPDDPQRIFVAISAAGTFRTDDGGETWQPINKGLRSREPRTRSARSAIASTGSR